MTQLKTQQNWNILATVLTLILQQKNNDVSAK